MSMYDLMAEFIEIYGTFCLISFPNGNHVSRLLDQ